ALVCTVAVGTEHTEWPDLQSTVPLHVPLDECKTRATERLTASLFAGATPSGWGTVSCRPP
ncbi:MAG: hypothetical protein JSW37_04155, partial [Anaerolineales bacterium]